MKDANYLLDEGRSAGSEPKYADLGQGIVSFADRIKGGAQRGIDTQSVYTIVGDQPALVVMEELMRRCDKQGL